jgi:3-phosphoshikimate 1-carboxyvinyltransferase
MPLPDLIEIVPSAASGPVLVTVPGSKSITNRALILAALSSGRTVLRGALWSDDTEVMVESLRRLGFEIEVGRDASEEANRTITVIGRGGEVPNAGSEDAPLELFVGNAGTGARFLMSLVALGHGAYRLSGVERMHQRPQRALIDALRQLGYRIEDEGRGCLPVVVHGEGPRQASCEVSIEESSQFASALLLSSRAGGWHVAVQGQDAEESAYVAMTLKLMRAFPAGGGEYQVEPDCSSASYFIAAGALLPRLKLQVAAWPESDWQIDGRFVDFARRFGDESPGDYPPLSRAHDLGDAIMTAIVTAPLLPKPSTFVDLGRLRVQESERVEAVRSELEKCGANVQEEGDMLRVFPSKLRGAEIETYDDHRIAMCFSTLGLVVPGMRIRHPSCVGKTFPNFYAKLAAQRPDGLGAAVLDAATGRRLEGEALLAEIPD